MRLTDEQRELTERYYRTALLAAKRWIRGKGLSSHTAEDVCASFVAALPFAVARWRPEGNLSLSAYLAYSLPRVAVDLMRTDDGREGTERRRATREMASLNATVAHGRRRFDRPTRPLELWEVCADPRAEDPSEACEVRDLAGVRLNRLRRMLPPHLFAAVRRWMDGDSPQQAADGLGVSVNCYQQRLYDAKRLVGLASFKSAK